MLRTFVFDVDGTICSTSNGNYLNAKPFFERIKKINELYEQGNTIIFFTARGMGSSINDINSSKEKYEKLTRNQLMNWGVKYHNLFLGKPAGDFYIDDKGISDKDFFIGNLLN